MQWMSSTVRTGLLVIPLATMAGCDPPRPFEVHFVAGAIGTPPVEKIQVDISQAGEAVHFFQRQNHDGRLQDIYSVERPIKIIVIEQDAAPE